MSRNKLRVTGFTRFLLFMLLVVPIAYFGASYYNGEDGIQKAKDLLGMDGEKTETSKSDKSTNADTANFNECQDKVERLERTIERREQEIKDLEKQVKALKRLE